MNTCDTCKWWGKDSDPDDFRKCQAANEQPAPDAFWTDAGWNDESYLFTGPKFGCVHWEGK